MSDSKLIDYAQTDHQRACVQAWLDHGGSPKAAEATGLNERSIRKAVQNAKARAAKQGYSPEHDMTKPVPDGFKLRGTSTLYDEEGKQRLQWVKSTADAERQAEMVQEAIEAMCRDIPKAKPREAVGNHDADLMSVYPMGDPHFGLYSWAKEVGESFDLKIAEDDLCAAVSYLVHKSPPSKVGVLINCGDFFHADNMAGTTARSGHVLDMDTRLPKMVDVGIRALRTCIETMLDVHETVHIVNAPGNHDEVLGHVLSILFRNLYEDEPRIIVHDQPTLRHYIEFGKVLIGTVHGDKTKDSNLMGIMATEMPEAWGRTKYRVFFRGHHHHDSRVEYNGGIVEQVRTLAAGDSYAVGHGYLSGRDMKCIVFNKHTGEQERYTCGIDVLRGAA